MRLETQAIHGGYDADPATRAVATPIYMTAAYQFDSADHAAALFDLEAEGFRYSRISNPTVAVLEDRIRQMEGGVGALCTSSGQAALHIAIANACQGHGGVVAVPLLYGTTHSLLSHVLSAQGIETRFAASERPEDVAAAIGPDTRAIFCETIGNPAGNLCDIRALADLAHAHGLPLIVDNTVATPVLWRPIEHGADVVVHSLTKYLGGHGTAMGGVIVDSGRFPWADHPERFKAFNTPDASYHGLVYTERFGEAAFIARCRSVFQRNMGAVLSPFNAFMILQGVETVALRMERHVENCRRVAEFLRDHSNVDWVNYAAFPESPYYALSQKYLGGKAAALLSFGIVGGLDAGKAFYDRLGLVKRVVNIGDTRSLACHPASTTHRQMPPEALIKAGVRPEMIRLSVGIEHIDDILADLDQALGQRTGATARQAA